jgi:hypothetical protein
MRFVSAVLCAATIVGLASSTTHAQQRQTRFDTPAYGTEWSVTPQYQPSPETFTLELRVGAYTPADLGAPYYITFGGNLGPMIGAELDGHIVRVPYLGPIVVGVAFGWANWSSAAQAPGFTGAPVGSTGMSLVMFTGLLGWRIDGLSREFDIPLVFTPKIGIDAGYWQTGLEGVTQGGGWTVGFHWGAQVALELDFLDRRAAHRLDNAWGINHSEIFFEILGAEIGPFSSSMLPLSTSFTWCAGLGFTF